jgi:hypothetical protein
MAAAAAASESLTEAMQPAGVTLAVPLSGVWPGRPLAWHWHSDGVFASASVTVAAWARADILVLP